MKKVMTSRKGIVLVAVLAVGFIMVIIGMTLLKLAEAEYSLTHKDVRKMKAFYLAEAGIENFVTNAYGRDFENIEETFLDEGSYRVDVYMDEFPPYAIATGKVGDEVKRIRVELSFLSFPYEHAIFGGNTFEQDWTLDLRGTGEPAFIGEGVGEVWRGGKDTVYGNIYAKGDVALYEESNVNPKYSENYDIYGDVDATGNANTYDDAFVSGSIESNVDALGVPDLIAMNYAENNTHNVSREFAEANVYRGRLPLGNDLCDVVVKNPPDRIGECGSTEGDDYFFEPRAAYGGGDFRGANTPLHLGEGRIYYVDGDVWIHNRTTYGFLVDGKVTIVATGDIHICDNVIYADKGYEGDLLGMVALGRYDSNGNLVSGGNVYFGDPRLGTMYEFNGLMFAANDFLYNTNHVDRTEAEPETGFVVYGNFAAGNHVTINRDWYDPDGTGQPRAARFDRTTGQWIDIADSSILSPSEIGSLRHYQMIVDYDERVRNADTQPPGLPRGPGVIFSGITYWEELSPLG
jgi:hypothetical protein